MKCKCKLSGESENAANWHRRSTWSGTKDKEDDPLGTVQANKFWLLKQMVPAQISTFPGILDIKLSGILSSK